MAILNQGGMGFPAMAGAPQALQAAYLRDPRLRLAQMLQLQGSDASPVQHWTQGAARLAQALAGNYVQDKADREYQKQADDYATERQSLYAPVMEQGAGGAGPRPDATMRPASFTEQLSRAQNLRSPYLQDDVRQIQMLAAQEAAKKADPMYGRTAVRGVGLVDMRGAQPQVVVPEQRQGAQPSLVQEFEFAKSQGFPGDFMAYQRSRAESTRPQTTVNTTVEPPQFETELQKTDAKRIAEYENNVLQSRRLLPDLDRLESAIKVFPTGMGGGGVLAFRQAMERIGVPVQGTSEGEIIQSIQSRLAPAMRPEGSGSSSNMDVQMFMESLPNLFRTPGGNMAIIRHMRHITQRQQREATFMRSYMQKNGNLGGVYEAMDAELGPVFPRVNTPEEAEKLAPGSLFVDPTGVMRVR